MALFGKKQKKAEDNQPSEAVASETVTTASTKPRKKKEMVSSVIDESVLEQILEEMKQNTQFISTYEGEPAYVGMLLKTEDIGGLNLKTNKDEAKGSIVECIKNGRIKVYASAELLDNEQFVIIPDAITLDSMSEFQILDIEYDLVKVTEDGEVHDTGFTATCAQMSDIIADDSMTIDDVIGSEGADAEEEYEPAEEYDESGIDVGSDAFNDEEMAFDGGEAESDSEGFEVSQEDTPSVLDEGVPDDEELSEYETDSPEDYQGAVDEDMAVEPAQEEEPQIDYTRDDFDAAITRKFYSDDLGLEVTTESFDQQFLHNNLFVPFAENRPEGWLNNYLNDMSKQFNQELYRLHQQNLVELRSEFFTMVSLGAQQIVAECDYTTTATMFGEQAELIKLEKNDAENNIEEAVARRKDEINQAWEAKLEEVAEAAASQARQQYRDRFNRQHEDDLFRIQATILDNIESKYNEDMRKLHEDRKQTANKKLDVFIHEALQQAALHRKEMLEAENARYHELQAELQKFMDENRKDEIARSEALAQELAQSNKADAVLAESTQKLRNMAAEYDAKRLSLLQEIEATEQKRRSDLAEQKAKHDEVVADLKEQNAALQARIDKLIEDFATLDEKKAKENESRIAELKSENQSWADKCDHIIETHKRSNIIGGFLAAAGVIAAIAIGFIAGEYININKTTQATNSQIISEFNESMNNIGSQSTQTQSDIKTDEAVPETQKPVVVEEKTPATETEATAPIEETTESESEVSESTEESNVANETNSVEKTDKTSSPKTDVIAE